MRILDQLSLIDISVIIIYIIGFVAAGAYASRKLKKSQDFTNAGKRLSWQMAAGSTIATCMGANMVIGKYDLIYESGMAGLTASLFWWFGWLFLIVMAKRLYKSGANSIPSFLEKRYNATTRKFSSYCVFISMVASCAAQFLTIGTILATLGVCDLKTGTWIGAILIVMFTVFSGLWGVAITDTFQSAILLVCFGVVFPILVFRVSGGFGAVIAATPPERLQMFSGIAPISMLGWAVSYALSTGSEPSYSQRIFSAKSMKDALWGQAAAWIATLVVAGFASALPGLAMKMVFPDLAAGNQFTIRFVVTYLPSVVKGLVMAALFGLMLTSGDTYLLLLVSTLTDDIVRPRFPKFSDKHMLLLMRVSCAVAAVVICAMALYVNKIYQLFKTGAGAYGAGVFFPLILGCFWKGARTKSINFGMAAGGLVSFLFDMFLKIPYKLNIDGCTIGAALCLIICVGGSLLESGREKEPLVE